MADPLVTVAELLAPAFAQVAGRGADAGPVDPVVRPSDRADAQANGALALAKSVGRTPRDLAAEVVAAAAPALTGVAALEVAGPGFINVTFTDAFVAQQLAAIAADDRLGVRPATTPEVVVVDYSAPNVAKEMHVGHLRSTVIGDSLVRLMELLGHRVIRENHIGDWGTPFGMLIEQLEDTDPADPILADPDPNVFYQAARARFDRDDEFKDRARRRVVLLQTGDRHTLEQWQRIVAISTAYFNRIYAQLGVLLTDDDLMGESRYDPMLAGVIERLAAAGLLQESDGAEVVFPPGYTNRGGDPLPLIVRKQGGGFNYATSDLACVIDRVERLGATLLVYVVGAPQAQHLQMVFDVATMAGWMRPPARAVHVAFGSILGPDRKMFKTRAGGSVKLQHLLDEAEQRGIAKVAEKSPDLPQSEREAVGRMIGIGAVKYADLSTDRVKDYVFDWERMLAFEGNTAPYLQYAHARIRSIFRRAEVEPSAVRAITPELTHPAERALALALLGFDGAVTETAERYAPHRLCTYLFDLAQAFSTFYDSCPVLRADSESLRLSRLALSDLTARVIERGLGLLGIAAPDRMRPMVDRAIGSTSLPLQLLPDTAEVAEDGSLRVGGRSIVELAAEFGTPLFVYDERHLRNRCREAVDAFGHQCAVYATKAFLCTAMARLAYEEGMLLDVASGGEMHVALRAGVPADALTLHGNNKSVEELRTAATEGVRYIVVDCDEELDRLECLHAEGVPVPRVVLRITPGVEAHTHEFIATGQDDSKFGFNLRSGAAAAAVERARRSPAVELVGVHSHIGSNVFAVESFARAAEVMAAFAVPLDLPELVLGGGLGVAYVGGEEAPTITEWGRVLLDACRSLGVRSRVSVEPGRSIVAAAAITVYTVGAIKEIPGVRTYVAVDGGMSDNPRPVLYGSGYEAFAPHAVTSERPMSGRVVGKHCESGDVLIFEAALPGDLRSGDLLATPVTGAYGHSMASNYNKLTRPPVVFVEDGEAQLVVRRETYDDLLRCDVL